MLIDHKSLIATILQKHISKNRISKHAQLLERLITSLYKGEAIAEEDIIRYSDLEGRIIAGDYVSNSSKISEDAKSKLFINVSLKQAIKCPICNGYLDTDKSVSYDHIERVRDGGVGSAENAQLTHPYCNQSVKQ